MAGDFFCSAHTLFRPSGFAPEGRFFVASISLRGGCRAGFTKQNTKGEIQMKEERSGAPGSATRNSGMRIA